MPAAADIWNLEDKAQVVWLSRFELGAVFEQSIGHSSQWTDYDGAGDFW